MNENESAPAPVGEPDYATIAQALRDHWQISEDVSICGVSRQAVCEAAEIIEALYAAPQRAPESDAVPVAWQIEWTRRPYPDLPLVEFSLNRPHWADRTPTVKKVTPLAARPDPAPVGAGKGEGS